ncbi:MAG: hypothetical protein DRP47_11815 [Candidatus Zixiibacteriota bacterium]|nr:MAG: hypothetical protein DRP47_11815 [candidate division Zixibacteria bacterium]
MVPNPSTKGKGCPTFHVKDEKGSALIIALLLLAIMSVFGAILMSTSTTEIQLSGNYRNTQESFYTADRAINYSMQGASAGSGVVDLYLDQNTSIPSTPIHRTLIAVDQSDLENIDENGDGTRDNPIMSDDRNSVIYIGSGAPPVGSGSDASLFKARNYAIDAVGIFPASAANPSRSELRAQFAKIVPK